MLEERESVLPFVYMFASYVLMWYESFICWVTLILVIVVFVVVVVVMVHVSGCNRLR